MAYFTLTVTCLLWSYRNVGAQSVVNPPTPDEGEFYTLTCDGALASPREENSSLRELRIETTGAVGQTNLLALFRLLPEVVKTQNIPTGASARNWSYVFTDDNSSEAEPADVMKIEIHVYDASSRDSGTVCCIALYDDNGTRGSSNVTKCQELTVTRRTDTEEKADKSVTGSPVNINKTFRKASNNSNSSVKTEAQDNPFEKDDEDEDNEINALPVIGEDIVSTSPVPMLGVVYAILFVLVLILLIWWHFSPPRDHVRQPDPKPDNVT